MFVMLVGPSDDINKMESKIVTEPNLTKGGLGPPEPNASYAPVCMYILCVVKGAMLLDWVPFFLFYCSF